MATQNNVVELVNRAWEQQRQGRASAAVTEFMKIIQQYPKDIDAHYGLALAQKASGETDTAIQTFKNTLELIAESKKIYESTREKSQELDTIKTPEDDRFMMLSRMVNQRLTELQKASKS